MFDFGRFQDRNIYVIGDSMADVYVHGEVKGCQDGCPKFTEQWRKTVPGGAANAAEALRHSGALVNIESAGDEHKVRFLDGGKIVYRHDLPRFPVSNELMGRYRQDTLKQLESNPIGGVYVADYAKGFLNRDFVRAIVRLCRERGVPCVIDPRRDPMIFCEGTYIKCNGEFAIEWGLLDHSPGVVITHGPRGPTIFSEGGMDLLLDDYTAAPTVCVNHVGAGDCFGAWLTLALASGYKLQDAARLAHAAGHVYVQHPHNRPPWPHEIRKQLDPVLGKILDTSTKARGLRESIQGRVVFANGVFRVPHAGHSWFLEQARRRGDALVVAVNDSVSAFRAREGGFCMPLEDRMQLLAVQQSVDWVIPFGEDTPVELMRALGLLPDDILAKGSDYEGRRIPGDDLCTPWFAPPGPFKGHSADLIKALRG